MKIILKILFKRIHLILIVFGLLYAQSYFELTLPEYTSSIIDVGVSKSGIDETVPKYLTARGYKTLSLLFIDDAKKTTFENSYEKDGENYKLVGSEKELEDIINIPIFEAYLLQELEVMRTENGSAALPSDMMDKFLGFNADNENGLTSEDIKALMSDSELFQNGEKITEFSRKMSPALEKMEPSLISQSNFQYIISEYKEIGIDITARQKDYMVDTGVTMLLFSLAVAVTTILVAYLAAVIGCDFAAELRGVVFAKTLKFSNAEFDKFSTATLITRSTNDVQQVQIFMVMILRMLLYAPIIGTGAVIKVVSQGSSLAWVAGVCTGILLLIVLLMLGFVLPKFLVIQKITDKLNLVSREILSGIPVIRAFAREDYEKERFGGVNRELRKVNLFVNRAMSILYPAMMFILSASSVLIVWSGAYVVDKGEAGVGELFAFISYTIQIIFSFLMIAMLSVILPRAIVSMRRLGEILSLDITVKDETKAGFEKSNNVKTALDFKDVSFKYSEKSDEYALKNIEFSVSQGEVIAIIGATGAGKSTLVNLINRFYDASKGEVLAFGRNIKEVSLENLREKVGYAPQKAMLFSGTIRENIEYGIKGETDDEWLLRALKAAQAHDEWSDLDAELSEGAANLSGGQKQRLSIARALAINPELYIFDDCFSALDFKTDRKLRTALETYAAGKTQIIVTQRVSTAMKADKILVLANGQQKGFATHSELINTCNEYREIALSQLSAEELGI